MMLAIDLLNCWLGRDRMSSLLPHRPPVLLLARARLNTPLEAEGQVRWRQVLDEWSRFSVAPAVVPTSLLVEAAAQLAGIVLASHAPATCARHPTLGLLAGIRKARVHRRVAPDRRFRLTARLRPMGNGMYLAAAHAWSGHALALTCDLMIHVPARKTP